MKQASLPPTADRALVTALLLGIPVGYFLQRLVSTQWRMRNPDLDIGPHAEMIELKSTSKNAADKSAGLGRDISQVVTSVGSAAAKSIADYGHRLGSGVSKAVDFLMPTRRELIAPLFWLGLLASSLMTYGHFHKRDAERRKQQTLEEIERLDRRMARLQREKRASVWPAALGSVLLALGALTYLGYTLAKEKTKKLPVRKQVEEAQRHYMRQSEMLQPQPVFLSQESFE